MAKKTEQKKKTAKSSALFKSARNLLVGGVNSPVRSFGAVGGEPLFVSKAKGAFVYDADGNRYVDYMASWGPLILGHAHPSVVKAVISAARSGTSYGVSCEAEVELAKTVTRSFPSIEKNQNDKLRNRSAYERGASCQSVHGKGFDCKV